MCDKKKNCFCTQEELHPEWNYSNQEQWRMFAGYYAFDRLPIDILTDKLEKVEKSVKIKYQNKVTGLVEKNENNIYFYPDKKENVVKFEGEKYVLTQLHFHSSAENRINGVISPMEIHFVHERMNAEKENPSYRLVVALVCGLTESKGLNFTTDIFNIPTDSKISLDLKELNVLKKYKHYLFNGGLTTPKFDSNIKWLLWNHEDVPILKINFGKYNIFRGQYPNNKANELSVYNDNRYAEPGNFLTIYENKS